MKQICRLPVLVMAVFMALSLVIPFTASAEMVKKVDNFIVIMDQSGSMAWAKAPAGHQKLDQAIDATILLDKVTPELGYTSSVAVFAPYKVVSDPATYKTGSLGSAATSIDPPFNNMTPLGDGLNNIDPVISKLSGKTALILFTDGESNQGTDPVAAAQALYGKYGSNLCLHVVSYADTPEGQQTIDAIRALNGCSVVADGKALVTDAAMTQFAKDVLYEEVAPKPAVVVPPPVVVAPAPAPVVTKEVITFNLLFGFDKWAITDEMVPVLEQAKMILEEDPGVTYVISGHADSTGPEAYNQGLSERRAASVKDWLVKNGISDERLETVGYGETRPKYDNSTREGRKLNRRVEIQSK
ncbi:MAG: OmpA family protein [Desulfuromonadales bacterium]|nr:OmpA family protein [Desulfuromonadales bacterium]